MLQNLTLRGCEFLNHVMKFKEKISRSHNRDSVLEIKGVCMGRRITRYFLTAICGVVGFFVSCVIAAEDCSDLKIQLEDAGGVVATIIESYDCWHEEGANNCRSINSFPGRLRLTGSRVHRVLFFGKEYAFVEALRKAGEKYVIGGFEWNEDDVFDFKKIIPAYVAGKNADIHFEFRDEENLNRIYGIEMPSELRGKSFRLKECSTSR